MPLFPFASLLPIVLLLFFPALVPAADNLGDNRRQLEEIQQRIDETARDLQEKRTARGKLKEDLQAVIDEENRLQRRLVAIEKEAAGLQMRLTEMTAKVEATQALTGRTEILVRKRLAALYKGGEAGPLQLFFSVQTGPRIGENYDYFGRIVRRDRTLLQEYRQQLTDLEASQRDLAELKKRRQGSLAALQKEQQVLLQTVLRKEELLARVRREENALGGELAELKERANRLSVLIKKLESSKPREYTPLTDGFAGRKGSLPWPVNGRVRVGFGTSRHPEIGTLRDSQGIEIEAADAQPITAVWPGQVIFADYFKGFGKMLILDHGAGYYTLYAQAARLSCRLGEQVAGGKVLAYAGAEGVYFEVRHHGVPLNPEDWLSGR